MTTNSKGQLVIGNIVEPPQIPPPSKRPRVESVETAPLCPSVGLNSTTIAAVVSSVTEQSMNPTISTDSSTNSSSCPTIQSSFPSLSPSTDAVHPSTNVSAESVPFHNTTCELGTTTLPNEKELCENVRFLKVAGTCVSLWLLPERVSVSQSSTCLNITNASTITALFLGHIWLATRDNFPEDGTLHHSWFSSILYATKKGITLSNESEDGARTLTVEENKTYLCRSLLIDIVLHPAAIVRMSDPNPSSRLACHLERMAGMKAAIFIYSAKAVLFLSCNNSLMMIDCHRNDSYGAVIVKGDINELPQFLRSIESTLGLDEICYGDFICFT